MPLPVRRRTVALPILLVAASAAFVPATAASAATLATSYDLAGTPEPSYINGATSMRTALTPDRGVLRYRLDPRLPSPAKRVGRLVRGQGLSLPNIAIPRADRFAVALSFRLDDVDPRGARGTVVPVVSFDGGASGAGLVVRDGVLGWRAGRDGRFTPLGTRLAGGAWQSVALSRTAGGSVRISSRGRTATIAAVALSRSRFGSKVRLLGPGSPGADVARVRTWDGPLTAAEAKTATGGVVDAQAPTLELNGRQYGPEAGKPFTNRLVDLRVRASDDGSGVSPTRWSLRAATRTGTSIVSGGPTYDDGRFDTTLPSAPALGIRSQYEVGGSADGLVDGATYVLCAEMTDRRGNVGRAELPLRVDLGSPEGVTVVGEQGR